MMRIVKRQKHGKEVFWQIALVKEPACQLSSLSQIFYFQNVSTRFLLLLQEISHFQNTGQRRCQGVESYADEMDLPVSDRMTGTKFICLDLHT